MPFFYVNALRAKIGCDDLSSIDIIALRAKAVV